MAESQRVKWAQLRCFVLKEQSLPLLHKKPQLEIPYNLLFKEKCAQFCKVALQMENVLQVKEQAASNFSSASFTVSKSLLWAHTLCSVARNPLDKYGNPL